jgi:hypothetical protein
MAKRLLTVGDIFLIEKGQYLYVTTRNRDSQEVIAGEPTEHQEYAQDKVVVKGREYFSKKYLKTVQHPVPKPGEYLVLATEYSGGSPHDDYPDGHKVIAKPVKGQGPKVFFYQTGCFTAMLKNPKGVKKAGTELNHSIDVPHNRRRKIN